MGRQEEGIKVMVVGRRVTEGCSAQLGRTASFGSE